RAVRPEFQQHRTERNVLQNSFLQAGAGMEEQGGKGCSVQPEDIEQHLTHSPAEEYAGKNGVVSQGNFRFRGKPWPHIAHGPPRYGAEIAGYDRRVPAEYSQTAESLHRAAQRGLVRK